MSRSDLLSRGGHVVPALLAFVVAVAVPGANGGYFPTEWGWSGIALLLVAGTAVAMRDDLPLGRLEWTMLGALTGFTGWIALSTVWSVSSSQPVLEVERNLVYVAALAAFFVVASRRSVLAVTAAVTAAITAVTGYALATRLFPDRVGSYPPPGGYQLSEPFGYWNALGLFVAIGMLLALGFASRGAGRRVRVPAAAALVPLACALYFTFSRGAWLALAAGTVVALALESERLRSCVVVLPLLPAPAVAVLLAARSHALSREGAPLAAAAHQGHRFAVVLVLLAVVQAAVAYGVCRVEPRLALDRRVGIVAAAALAVLAASGAAAVLVRAGGPGKLVGNAYDAFLSPERPNATDLNRRLVSLSGSGRVDYWRVAWRQYRENPLLGSGAGSYERYWIRDRPNAFYARNAHNLYLEVLAELGPVGLLLLLVALGTPLVAAARSRGSPLVATTAGAYATFLLHAGIDWDWEMTGLTVTGLLCGAVLVVAARPERPAPVHLRTRHLVAALAVLVPLVAFVFVLQVGNTAIARAASAAGHGDFGRAEASARRAEQWAPWSYEPWQFLGETQLATRNLGAARRSFRTAISKDTQNWRLWFDLAEASKGRVRQQALRRAAELAPRSTEVAELRRRAS